MTDSRQDPGKTFFTVRKALALIALVLICRLFSNAFFPVFDPSEARYADICANMARSGNFLEPEFIHDGKMQIFEGKPPLYFQMGAISCKIFGIHEFSVRLPAMLCAVGMLLLIYFAVRRLKGEKVAVLATLLGAVSPVFLAFAGFCMTDLMLAFAVSAMVLSYVLFLAEPQKAKKKLYSLGFFAAMGVGMIVKGPVALVLAGMPIFCFTLIDRRWRDLKDHAWVGGILLFLLIAAPWFAMMQAKNPDFLEYFFVNENFKRFLFKDYGDRYGAGRESFRGVALLFMIVCNLPGGLLALLPLRRGKKFHFSILKGYFREPLGGMALLWLGCDTFFWCLTSRVLITYLLPTIPAAAIVVADLLVRSDALHDDFVQKRLHRATVALFALYAVLCVAGPWAIPVMRDNAGHFFRDLAKSDKCKGQKFYFMRRTPYSAEFYMGARVKNHPDEVREISVPRARAYILLTTERDLRKYGKPMPRQVIDRCGPWVALSPETVSDVR